MSWDDLQNFMLSQEYKSVTTAASRADNGSDEDENGDRRPKVPVGWSITPPELGTDRIVIVDMLTIAMIDVPERGARILFQPITKLQAMSLLHHHPYTYLQANDFSQTLIEQHLQIEPIQRAQVTLGTRLLVFHKRKWNDVGWYLVTWESDGDGCVP